jgi:DNA-binding response OmpR family regulator
VDDRVKGLDAGADDYLIKPFEFLELLARLRKAFKHEQILNRMEYQLADLNVDLVKRLVYRAGKQVNLTSKEFEILELLMRNQHQAISRQTIAREIWRVQRATPIDNVIDVHVMRLRKKIDDNCHLKLIHTIRGLGFMISDKNLGS